MFVPQLHKPIRELTVNETAKLYKGVRYRGNFIKVDVLPNYIEQPHLMVCVYEHKHDKVPYNTVMVPCGTTATLSDYLK